jgi:hypothetical protein
MDCTGHLSIVYSVRSHAPPDRAERGRRHSAQSRHDGNGGALRRAAPARRPPTACSPPHPSRPRECAPATSRGRVSVLASRAPRLAARAPRLAARVSVLGARWKTRRPSQNSASVSDQSAPDARPAAFFAARLCCTHAALRLTARPATTFAFFADSNSVPRMASPPSATRAPGPGSGIITTPSAVTPPPTTPTVVR